MSQHPAGIFNTAAPFRRGPPAPLYFSTLTAPKRAIVFMAELDVDGITTATTKRIAFQIGIFHGLYRHSRQVTALTPERRRYATHPLITAPDDDPPMAEITAALAPVRLDRNLDLADGRFGSLATSAVGVLTLQNSDGSLDDLDAEVAIAGRDVRISAAALARSETGVDTVMGDSLFDVLVTEAGDILVTELSEQLAVDTVSSQSVLAGFGPIFTGVVESLGWLRNEVQIKVRDARLRLERPVQRSAYSGAGGFDGTPEMAGTTRPMAFGFCTGVAPVLIDPILLIYQYHHGESRAVDAVYDGALALRKYRTVRTYAEMAALAAPTQDEEEGEFPLGTYIACPLAGCFRLAGPAERAVTADVRGAGGVNSLRETFSDGTLFTDGTGWKSGASKVYSRTAADILLRILIEQGGLTEDEVSIAQMKQVALELPYEAGIYFAAGETGSVLDAASRLAASLGCILMRAKDGRYQLRRLTPPTEVPVITIRADMIAAGSLERMPLPYRVPWTDWEVTFARNWSPLSESELFQEVPQERRFLLGRESQVTTVTNNLVASIYSERAPARIDTLLTHQGDAREVGDRHAELYTHGRAMFGLSVSGIAYRLEILDTVRVIANRYGLEQGRHLLVVAVGEDGDAIETKLTLFG